MIIETIPLDAIGTIVLHDRTSHYFGGYFHVRVAATCSVPVKSDYFASRAEYDQAVVVLGETVTFTKNLEKMAVAEVDLESVRAELIAAFRATTYTYLVSDHFAPRFIHSELVKRQSKKSPVRFLQV